MKYENVIKALECCGNQNYSCTDKLCKAKVLGEAVELIRRQQAEKEALIAGQETLQKCIAEKNAEIEELKAKNNKIHNAWSQDLQDKLKVIHKQNEQLDDLRLERYGIKSVNKAIPTTKAVKRYIERKAYKEFAVRFIDKVAGIPAWGSVAVKKTNDTLKELTEVKDNG